MKAKVEDSFFFSPRFADSGTAGGLAGAIFLDQAFKSFWARKVGQENWDQVPQDEKELFLDSQWELGLKQLYTHGRKYTFHLSGTLVQVTGKTRIELTKYVQFNYSKSTRDGTDNKQGRVVAFLHFQPDRLRCYCPSQ